jgi:DNA invertase Pin-like site-specific DNA recombinase
MKIAELPEHVVQRRAVVYVRQSTMAQVHDNKESQRRQYDLVDLARGYGFVDVATIDEDLGRSASGLVARPGFESLVAQMCQGAIGAVFCLEASRLARNGREWHHLLELCGLVGARVIDVDGVYDPSHPNDRLLLGLKGTMSEFELTLIRRRLVEGMFAKARRGEFRLRVPVGYSWSRDTGLEVNPDRRVHDAIATVFRLFARFESARKTHLHMVKNGVLFPRSVDARRPSPLRWATPTYSNVKCVLQNPFYAGAYAYGKSTNKTEIVDGKLTKTYGHNRPLESWSVLIKDHHDAFVTWADFERNQEILRRNAHRNPAGRPKAGRGGRALLTGLLRCRRCGRMLTVGYSAKNGNARYACRYGHATFGLAKCISFGASRPDDVVAAELLRVVEPLAIEAAMNAFDLLEREAAERKRALELELQQAEYEVQLARRRYESVDPDNRLVAVELEARWNAALAKLHETETRLHAQTPAAATPIVDKGALLRLAGDLKTAWDSPTTDSGVKQRLIRTLIEEIVVDVDDAARELILLIHWRGGRHSELRAKKPASGNHKRNTPVDAVALIREMTSKWPDEHIAATLNRMGIKTGYGHSWNEERVRRVRFDQGLPTHAAANLLEGPDREITMSDAAKALDVSRAVVKELIDIGVLPAKHLAPEAPWQIRAADLELPAVRAAADARRRPCRSRPDPRNLEIPGTSRGDAE